MCTNQCSVLGLKHGKCQKMVTVITLDSSYLTFSPSPPQFLTLTSVWYLVLTTLSQNLWPFVIRI